MTRPDEVEALAADRCPGCGSIVHERFQSCAPVAVDVTKTGYRYLADTWGYCLTLGRHVGKDEPDWLRSQLVERERAGLQYAIGSFFGAIPSARDFTADERRHLAALRRRRDQLALSEAEG